MSITEFLFGEKPAITRHGELKPRSGLGGIGNTPLIELKYRGCAPIFAKAEFTNPTGSHKDRAYLAMVESLEAAGELVPGKNTLVDYTSGNGGASLAFIGREKGYRTILTMPEDMTRERKDQIEYYGGELILTPKGEFIRGARLRAEGIAAATAGAILINQSENANNARAFKSMGEEVLAFARAQQAVFSVFVGAIGTGASIAGLADAFNEAGQRLSVVGFETMRSATSLGAKLGITVRTGKHRLIGTSPGKVAKNTDLASIGHIELIGEREEREGARMMRRAGFWLGTTSEAALYVAKRMAHVLGEGNGAVLTVFYDAGWKYYSDWSGSHYVPLGRPETERTDDWRSRIIIHHP